MKSPSMHRNCKNHVPHPESNPILIICTSTLVVFKLPMDILSTLGMRRIRIAAWQMVSCPSDAKGRRYWEESVILETSSPWQTELLGASFYAFLGRRLDTETEGL